jgi:hypothetical protein
MATTKKPKSRTRSALPNGVFSGHSLLGIHADRLERIAVTFQIGNPDLIESELYQVADELREMRRVAMAAAGMVDVESAEVIAPGHRVVMHPHTGKPLRLINGGAT